MKTFGVSSRKNICGFDIFVGQGDVYVPLYLYWQRALFLHSAL